MIEILTIVGLDKAVILNGNVLLLDLLRLFARNQPMTSMDYDPSFVWLT